MTLGNLSDLLIGPVEIANCFHGDYSNCELTGSCSVIGPMLNLNERISELFHGIPVSDLIQSKHNREKSIREKPITGQKAS